MRIGWLIPPGLLKERAQQERQEALPAGSAGRRVVRAAGGGTPAIKGMLASSRLRAAFYHRNCNGHKKSKVYLQKSVPSQPKTSDTLKKKIVKFTKFRQFVGPRLRRCDTLKKTIV